MNELPEPKTLIELLGGLVVTLLSVLAARQDRRIERLERHSAERAEMLRLHAENLQRLEDIKSTTTRTHARIDELYRDIVLKAKQ